jgi:hypothetical protein
MSKIMRQLEAEGRAARAKAEEAKNPPPEPEKTSFSMELSEDQKSIWSKAILDAAAPGPSDWVKQQIDRMRERMREQNESSGRDGSAPHS